MSNDELGMAHGRAFEALHPARLSHPLEGTLRREWERYVAERPGFDILCGPEVRYAELPEGIESDENKLTGAHQPYPYGRMTKRDHMVASELIQWLGSPNGFAFISTALKRAGCEVKYSDLRGTPAGAAKEGK